MHEVSSRPDAAAGGAPFPGSLRDMTESTDSMTQVAQSRVFVDGNNVMGSRPDGWWRDRAEAARRLAAEITPVALGHGGVWTIVFDGNKPPAMPLPPKCLTVIHTGHGRPNGADDRIVELVDALPNWAASLVYTSDAKLRNRVEALGTQVAGSGTLLRQIATARGTMAPIDTGHSLNPADGAGTNDHRVTGSQPECSTCFRAAYGPHRSRAEAPHRSSGAKSPAPPTDWRPDAESPIAVASVARTGRGELG